MKIGVEDLCKGFERCRVDANGVRVLDRVPQPDPPTCLMNFLREATYVGIVVVLLILFRYLYASCMKK